MAENDSTAPDQSVQSAVEALAITQDDRDAAADYMHNVERSVQYAQMVRLGFRDGHGLVSAFARHRLASLPAAGEGDGFAYKDECGDYQFQANNPAPSDQQKLANLLTAAVGDITSALMLAGKKGKIAEWTAPYVDALNEFDATTRLRAAGERGA